MLRQAQQRNQPKALILNSSKDKWPHRKPRPEGSTRTVVFGREFERVGSGAGAVSSEVASSAGVADRVVSEIGFSVAPAFSARFSARSRFCAGARHRKIELELRAQARASPDRPP